MASSIQSAGQAAQATSSAGAPPLHRPAATPDQVADSSATLRTPSRIGGTPTGRRDRVRAAEVLPGRVQAACDRAVHAAGPLQLALAQTNMQQLDKLQRLIGNVHRCLEVMQAALPGESVQLSDREAGVHQVAAAALGEFLIEAEKVAGGTEEPAAAMHRVRDVLMHATSLMACLDAALWHVSAGRDESDEAASLTGGDVTGACALIQSRLVEALTRLCGNGADAVGAAQ